MKTNLNFEINLLPVISLLAVLISVLLLTTVWVNIAGVDVSQAVGKQASKEKTAAVWIEFKPNGAVVAQIKDTKVSRSWRSKIIKTKNRPMNWKHFEAYVQKMREVLPVVETAMIFPRPNSSYEDVIKSIDIFRANNIVDVGIAPL